MPFNDDSPRENATGRMNASSAGRSKLPRSDQPVDYKLYPHLRFNLRGGAIRGRSYLKNSTVVIFFVYYLGTWYVIPTLTLRTPDSVFSLGFENERADAGRDGRTRFAETKFSGANGDTGKKKKHFPCSTNDKQNWQPYPLIHTLQA